MFLATTITTAGLLLGAGATEPPEPSIISPGIVEMVIADPAISAPVCDTYRELTTMIAGLGMDVDAQLIFVEIADAYLIVNMEGDDMRLDAAARDTLVDWLHTSCVG